MAEKSGPASPIRNHCRPVGSDGRHLPQPSGRSTPSSHQRRWHSGFLPVRNTRSGNQSGRARHLHTGDELLATSRCPWRWCADNGYAASDRPILRRWGQRSSGDRHCHYRGRRHRSLVDFERLFGVCRRGEIRGCMVGTPDRCVVDVHQPERRTRHRLLGIGPCSLGGRP